MIKKKFLPTKLAKAKLISWAKVAPKKIFPLSKGSQAGVVIDSKGAPQLFIFNTFALLDMLSEIDERLADRLSDEEYHSKEINPSGWLIDEIESRMPLKPKYLKTLRSALNEAKKKGWIPFEKIERDLHLA